MLASVILGDRHTWITLCNSTCIFICIYFIHIVFILYMLSYCGQKDAYNLNSMKCKYCSLQERKDMRNMLYVTGLNREQPQRRDSFLAQSCLYLNHCHLETIWGTLISCSYLSQSLSAHDMLRGLLMNILILSSSLPICSFIFRYLSSIVVWKHWMENPTVWESPHSHKHNNILL